MDDIAAALGISKRTLYEVFSDKESLLKECILKAQADRDKYLQKVFEQSHNVLEVILAVFQKSIEMFHQTNKRFFEDIKKYPKVYEMMKNRQDMVLVLKGHQSFLSVWDCRLRKIMTMVTIEIHNEPVYVMNAALGHSGDKHRTCV
jgi:AcrR family transcriptional regulator